MSYNKYILIIIFVLLSTLINDLFADNSLINRYNELLYNLKHHSTFGYRELYIDNRHTIFEQGMLQVASNTFAIMGEGFFRVKDIKTNNIFYTRCGSFIIKGEKLLTKKVKK